MRIYLGTSESPNYLCGIFFLAAKVAEENLPRFFYPDAQTTQKEKTSPNVLGRMTLPSKYLHPKT